MGRLNLSLALLLAAVGTAAAQQPTPEIVQAGSCGRCHISSVLEWGLSLHQKKGTDCVACHGASQGHIIDERNNVKPERIPRGAAIASLCATCHTAGCPKSKQTANCQTCHHPHALLDPNKGRTVQDAWTKQADDKLAAFNRNVAEGARLVSAGSFPSARDAFRRALEQIPGNPGVAAKLRMCERRINPALAGFEILGSEFDAESGLARRVRVSGSDIEMVLIPAGDSDMGSDRFRDSAPVHTVRVDAYYLATTEMTQGQWKALMGANPSQYAKQADADRLPVEQVSWDDCQAFIRKLNERAPGKGFRLPTEAEWEYAARAGSSSPLPHDQLLLSAWFAENTVSGAAGPQVPLTAHAPRPVGSRQPNAWGLYDMLGNVWEWTSSASRPYPFDAQDGRESETAAGMRVVRGGGFIDSEEYLDPAMRHPERSDSRLRWNGFRLARTVPAPAALPRK